MRDAIADRTAHPRAISSPLIAGAVIGTLTGVAIDVLGVRGLAILAVVVIASALVQPRFALLAGVLLAAGGLWLVFSLAATASCTVDPASCSGPSPIPFAAVSALVVAAGMLALATTRRRMR